MQFSDVLASSVHDIKNSLAMVINSVDTLLQDPQTRIGDPHKATVLQQEAQRANNNLIQLLSLYKLEREQLAPNIVEQNVDEFLEEICAENAALTTALGVALESDCEDMLTGYFDDNLVRGVVNSTIGNAQRYTADRILLSATEEDGYLVLRIEDNGRGYPAEMLENTDRQQVSDAFSSGRTQLGLLFASEIAHLHTSGERHGFIRLRNGHTLGGGCFELWLP